MRRIYLVRHAQSEFNEKGIFQGRLDSDLTPLGFVQARMVARFLEREGIEAVLTSPQRRAYKTALTVGDVLGLEVEVDERLKEMSFGILEGRRFWDLLREEGSMMRSWLTDPLRNPLPTQEPVEKFEKRILSFLEDLRTRPEERIAVIGHGGTLHGILCLTLGMGLGKLWWVHMDNTGVTLLEEGQEGFRLVYLNSLCHLRR